MNNYRNGRAIVLLSGGQDSTTCLFWALTQFKEVVAIGFDYGQKHAIELKQAAKIADIADVPYKVFDCKGLLGGSALVDHSQDVSAAHKIRPDLPASFTAGRNALFLTIAASYGFGMEFRHIVTGVCQTDFSGYPDCRQEFVSAMEIALQKALDSDVKIHTPLMNLTKAETWKLAKQISENPLIGADVVRIVKEHTITDYNGSTKMNDWGMGELDNPASELRARGYHEAVAKGWI
jgi:7-cyano-7-deazaguanine synthase